MPRPAVAVTLPVVLVEALRRHLELAREARGDDFLAENAGVFDDIGAALERALRFATEMARMTTEAASCDELFAAEAALRDAIGGFTRGFQAVATLGMSESQELILPVDRARLEQWIAAGDRVEFLKRLHAEVTTAADAK